MDGSCSARDGGMGGGKCCLISIVTMSSLRFSLGIICSAHVTGITLRGRNVWRSRYQTPVKDERCHSLSGPKPHVWVACLAEASLGLAM